MSNLDLYMKINKDLSTLCKYWHSVAIWAMTNPPGTPIPEWIGVIKEHTYHVDDEKLQQYYNTLSKE